jgi:hypothetical protein
VQAPPGADRGPREGGPPRLGDGGPLDHKPAIDEEANSAIFLRYKGAEAGEVDWRPTETIPEDFYAM